MKKAFSLLCVLALCLLLSGCGNHKLNETVIIDRDNIKITVLGTENVTIDEGELSIRNGDFTKVKVTIENTGTQTYEWTLLNFKLGDDILALNGLTFDDVLLSEIEAGTSETGYLYFPKNESSEFIYNSKYIPNNDGESAETTSYIFDIK